jgi:cellulose synthase/poly-beta-1,6-N-acetylglucosamine synthase-like glycosyltransferase
MRLLFWVSLGVILYTYAGYPVALGIVSWYKKLARMWGQVPLDEVLSNGTCPHMSEACPSVSVIISVYNEEGVIRDKIENCLALDYPKDKMEILVGSDGSDDGTNGILKEMEKRGIKIFISPGRQGKPGTINRLVKEAKGGILFFTDARQDLDKAALLRLVTNFQDKEIGCASGELLYKDSRSITGRGIGAYWKYEKYLREKESDIYSMIGATGAIYACRKELFEPILEDIILDDVYVPLQVVKKGHRAVFDRYAKAYDVVGETPRDEHRRKIRTLSGNYQIFFKMPYMLNPFKSRLAVQLISHKLLRVAVPFFMIALFFSSAALAAETFFRWMLIGQIAFYSMALIEAVARKRIKKIFGMPYLFCLLNFSALMGFLAFVFNKQDIRWQKAKV